jgi:hypothetical protein
MAYKRQAKTIWMVNVGDIKGLVSELTSLALGHSDDHRKFQQAISLTLLTT